MSYEDALTFADDDINENRELYKERFLEGLQFIDIILEIEVFIRTLKIAWNLIFNGDINYGYYN